MLSERIGEPLATNDAKGVASESSDGSRVEAARDKVRKGLIAALEPARGPRRSLARLEFARRYTERKVGGTRPAVLNGLPAESYGASELPWNPSSSSSLHSSSPSSASRTPQGAPSPSASSPRTTACSASCGVASRPRSSPIFRDVAKRDGLSGVRLFVVRSKDHAGVEVRGKVESETLQRLRNIVDGPAREVAGQSPPLRPPSTPWARPTASRAAHVASRTSIATCR